MKVLNNVCVDPVFLKGNPLGQYSLARYNALSTTQTNYGMITYRQLGPLFVAGSDYTQLIGPPIAGDGKGLKLSGDPSGGVRWALNCAPRSIVNGIQYTSNTCLRTSSGPTAAPSICAATAQVAGTSVGTSSSTCVGTSPGCLASRRRLQGEGMNMFTLTFNITTEAPRDVVDFVFNNILLGSGVTEEPPFRRLENSRKLFDHSNNNFERLILAKLAVQCSFDKNACNVTDVKIVSINIGSSTPVFSTPIKPSTSPSSNPIVKPTRSPRTKKPSSSPSRKPNSIPTTKPTRSPTRMPSKKNIPQTTTAPNRKPLNWPPFNRPKQSKSPSTSTSVPTVDQTTNKPTLKPTKLYG